MSRTLTVIALTGALLPGMAIAGTPSATTITDTFTFNGNVSKLCSLGSVKGSNTINIGDLINAATGTLATIASPPATAITGSWCNTASTVSVEATPMVAQSFGLLPPPSGFTKAVNYTATVTTWTTAAATYTTTGNEDGLQLHPGAAGAQLQSSPNASDIDVTVGSFTAPSSGDFLVADNNYSGTITITLTAN